MPSKASNLAGFASSISSNNNLNVGIVTASGFVGNVTGNLTGNVTGNATGLSGTPNLNVGVVTASSFVGNLTGTASTATAAATAFGLSGSPNVTVGVITATTFSGNGAGLTGVGIGTTGNVNTTGIGTFGTVVATADLDIPNGTTAQRPAVPTAGSFRYNSEIGLIEFYTGTEWKGVYLTVSIVPDPSGTGIFGGGYTPSQSNIIDYITIASVGNATDFGDLTVARNAPAACSSSTRGVFGGGNSSNTIDYITIATTGNATDFGDLTQGRNFLASCSSSTRGIFGVVLIIQ